MVEMMDDDHSRTEMKNVRLSERIWTERVDICSLKSLHDVSLTSSRFTIFLACRMLRVNFRFKSKGHLASVDASRHFFLLRGR